MFKQALRYPTESDDWTTTVLIGGALIVLGPLIIPTFLVYGYLVSVIRERFDANPEPPRFENWGEMLVEGFTAWAVTVVYMLLPLLVAGITVGGAAVAIATGERALSLAGLAGLLGGLGVTAVLSLLFGYVSVAGVVTYARTGRFGSAFDVGTLRRVCLDGNYAVAWLASVVVFLAVGLLSGALNAIPLLGYILGAFLTFYGSVAAGYLWADGYRAALANTEEFGPEATEEATV
jgi:hypothetical protein